MKSHMTIKNILVHPKDKIEKLKTSGVVYGIPCKDCDAVYIGQTGRPLSNKIKEHRKEVEEIENSIKTRQDRREQENKLFKSAITDHAVHNNHTIDWNSTCIKDKENNNFRRIIKESIYISAEKSKINRDCGGYKLPSVYQQVLKDLSVAQPRENKSKKTNQGQGNSNLNSSDEGNSL